MANIRPYGVGFDDGYDRPAGDGDGLVDNTGNTISGFTGVVGFTGVIGSTGLVGIQGVTGLSLFGATGIEGVQGLTGVAGQTGISGFTGVRGYTGISFTGETGVIGATGVRGTTGIGGSFGYPGLQGATGLTSGTTGTAGQTGSIGITGAGSLPGVTGVQGTTGILGTTGLQGITGFGLLGSTGIQGLTGLAGITGINDLVAVNLQRQPSGATILYVVPANTLSTNGQYLEFFSTVITAEDGAPSTLSVVFGGTPIFSDTLNGSNVSAFIQGVILRLGATSQECVVAANYSDGDSHTQRTATSIALSSNQNLVTNTTNLAGGAAVRSQVLRKMREV